MRAMLHTPALPPVLARAASQPNVLHWRCWTALAPGPALIVMGAVHGDEVCGAHACAALMEDLDAGRLTLTRGRLTVLPVANPLAFARGTREGEGNLNRRFVPQAAPANNEERLAAQLAPLLGRHDALLDLHSFHTPGEPFAMVGPLNNSGTREPFARAAEEMALACALGAPRVVQGWLEVYDAAARAAIRAGGEASWQTVLAVSEGAKIVSLPTVDGCFRLRVMETAGGNALQISRIPGTQVFVR